MFTSEYRHTVDAKGRLIIPAKFREEFGNQFCLTRGLDGCLFLFPEMEWKEFENKLRQLPVTFNKDARQFVRFFTTGATNGQFDKQGRILIPQTLREFANIQKDVVVAGSLNKLEIWSKERWDTMNSFDDMDAIAANLQGLGYNF
ncbi:MAG TPA: division/cell wall cluster transcriptional repressor MraZ [Candidatus Fimousia stercorigallinarum]|nr:division/cell wall cluster transcriptional repressor MraZ [Candidatus Fimousia stercorigallinarum]